MKYLRDNGKIFVEYVFDNYYMCRGFAVTVALSYGRNQLFTFSLRWFLMISASQLGFWNFTRKFLKWIPCLVFFFGKFLQGKNLAIQSNRIFCNFLWRFIFTIGHAKKLFPLCIFFWFFLTRTCLHYFEPEPALLTQFRPSLRPCNTVFSGFAGYYFSDFFFCRMLGFNKRLKVTVYFFEENSYFVWNGVRETFSDSKLTLLKFSVNQLNRFSWNFTWW